MPLIIRVLVPVVPKQYQKCLTVLCQITQIVVSAIVTSDTLGDLEELVAQHHQLYGTCYGAEVSIAKHHMLIHLPDQMRSFGPARHHWAMRMEGNNCLSK